MSNEKRLLVITPNNIAFSVINPDHDVCLHLDLDRVDIGLGDIAFRVPMTENPRHDRPGPGAIYFTRRLGQGGG